jgi:hypothetical protein
MHVELALCVGKKRAQLYVECFIEYKTTPPCILIQKYKVLLYIEYKIKEFVLNSSSVHQMYHNPTGNQKGKVRKATHPPARGSPSGCGD